ncbi:MAG TPA: site-2 protease family protein, partial [Lacipirellulaceae bacterium]|nr:site-2 protease family protein [Lacipirellulaceae bacterium]
IFAFIFAVIAYKIGVPYNPTVVSQTEPGSPAWRADLRPGDEAVRIADGVEGPSFDELRGSVSLGDIEAGIPFVIRRGDERIEKRLFPKQGRGMPRVGMAPPFSLIVGKAFADTAAAEASPPFEPGDAIEAVDGVPVTTFAQFSSILAQRPGDELRVTVRRGGEPAPNARGGPLTGGEMVDITLPARPRRTLGLVMQMGRIANVQDNSPAAGQLAAGDFIDRIADAAGSPGGDRRAEPLAFDPMTLPDDLRQMADNQREVEIVVRRRSSGDEGRQTTETIVIPLRRVQWLEAPLGGENEPVVATALGAAYHVLSVVARVEPDSPAAKAGLQVNDVVTHAEFLLPEDAKDMPPLKPLEFSSDEDDRKANWPSLMALVNELPPGSQVKLVFRRGNETLTATVAPEDDPRYFNPERGLAFHVLERMRIADTWSEAGRLGWDETVGALSMVYRFLGKLGTQVSVTSLGGPITIAKAAGFSAFEGPGKLLIFLTMLSANLAVLNFLPIPLLDGGHMVFLIWEGIRGKPANEKFMMATQTAGFVFIITLMLFVLSLDLELIPRKL